MNSSAITHREQAGNTAIEANHSASTLVDDVLSMARALVSALAGTNEDKQSHEVRLAHALALGVVDQLELLGGAAPSPA